MEAWRQWPLGGRTKPCSTKLVKNRLDSDRPSHGRPLHSKSPASGYSSPISYHDLQQDSRKDDHGKEECANPIVSIHLSCPAAYCSPKTTSLADRETPTPPNAQFGEGVSEMVPNRIFTDPEALGDFPVGRTLLDGRENFQFAGSKAVLVHGHNLRRKSARY